MKFFSRFTVALLGFALLFCASLGSASAASFDCSKAASLVETSVCSNPQLSALDDELDAAYRTTAARSADKAAFKAAQVMWLTTVRNKCSTERCLSAVYRARVLFLNSVPSSVPSLVPSSAVGGVTTSLLSKLPAVPAMGATPAQLGFNTPELRCRAWLTVASETSFHTNRYNTLKAAANALQCKAAQGIDGTIAAPARALQTVAEQRKLPAMQANACLLFIRASAELERACK